MAALILGAGALAYDQVQKGRAKRKARKDFNSQRFSELERENAERIGGLQRETCFCQSSDWDGQGGGGGCPVHGRGEERREAGGGGETAAAAAGGRRSGEGEPPAYVDVTSGLGEGGARQRGHHEEEEAGQEEEEEEGHAGGASYRARAPETEVERLRINEERRKKDKGFKRLFGRKKGGQEMVTA